MARTYRLDEHYFDAVDNPSKAYWLGFLLADGNVLTSPDARLSLELADRDSLAAIRYDKIWTFSVVGSRKPQTVLRILYADPVVALSRKQVLAQELLATDFNALWLNANRRRSIANVSAWKTRRILAGR